MVRRLLVRPSRLWFMAGVIVRVISGFIRVDCQEHRFHRLIENVEIPAFAMFGISRLQDRSLPHQPSAHRARTTKSRGSATSGANPFGNGSTQTSPQQNPLR